MIWIQVFKCWSRYVMFDFDLSSEILGSSQWRFVHLPAGLIVARRVANQPVAQVGSRWFHRLHQLSARKKGILQEDSGASSFRLFGSQLVSISLHWSCELRGSFSYRCYKKNIKITRPEARSVMTPSCGSMFPTCFWCGSNLPRASCAMLTPVYPLRGLTLISPSYHHVYQCRQCRTLTLTSPVWHT